MGSESEQVLHEIGIDPSASESNRYLHVDIFRFLSINFKVYFMASSKTIGTLFKVLNLNQIFLKLHQSICK